MTDQNDEREIWLTRIVKGNQIFGLSTTHTSLKAAQEHIKEEVNTSGLFPCPFDGYLGKYHITLSKIHPLTGSE
jgi:hypothetical protein